MGLGQIASAPLENWLRDRYFTASIDISGSGVLNFTLGELRALTGITQAELDGVMFRDSPSTGCAPLREAIAARFAPGRADAVMVTHGSTEGIFLALSAVLRTGDEVVVLSPVYHALTGVAEAAGARLKVWELRAEDGFRPDLEQLSRLVSDRTRAIVVNFPHNPTGAILDAAGSVELSELVTRHGCYLFWDGAFGELAYGRARFAAPTEPRDRIIWTGTLSKAYGLPGIRIGWCVAPAGVLADMVRIRDYTTISTSPLAELIATGAIRHADALLAPRLELARSNRALLLDWVAANPTLVSCPAPLGGVCAFPRFPGLPDVTPAAELLADRYGVLVVPGACFGQPDRLRIGFGGAAAELATGLRHVTTVVTELTRHRTPELITSGAGPRSDRAHEGRQR